MAMVAPSAVRAEGDAIAGERVFARCTACHQVGAGASNAVGPHLNGLMGRAIGSVPGYAYSDGLLSRNQQAWTADSVVQYIGDPGRFIGERSRMPAQRLRPNQVADLITYLQGN